MDTDLLYSNKFINDASVHGGYGLTEELRRQKLQEEFHQILPTVTQDQLLLDTDMMRTNRVIDDEGNAKLINTRTIQKEIRMMLSINSNQRQFFERSDLGDPVSYQKYLIESQYDIFAELYNRIKTLQLAQDIPTYDEYSDATGFTLAEANSRELVQQLLNERFITSTTSVAEINANLIDLLESSALVLLGQSTIVGLVNWLNVIVMSGGAVDPTRYWRPFYIDDDNSVKQILYKEQHPNNYRVVLPNSINHVKSIRLLSTEVPNTISNVTERNNLIIIKLQRITGHIDIALDPTKSLFNFILVKLDIGAYTVSSLLAHMQERMNTITKNLTVKSYGEIFRIDFNQNSGAITIRCINVDLEFHLKFYSITNGQRNIVDATGNVVGKSHGTLVDFSDDLWFRLGFPWPFELEDDGSDLYTKSMTNVVNFGIHKVFAQSYSNDDFFNRSNEDFQELFTSNDFLIPGHKSTVINTYRPYGYPHLEHKYVYMIIKNFPNLKHITTSNQVIAFNDCDIFAKVLMNVSIGSIAYNTFVCNPLIFTNVHDKIEYLDIQWVDERGQLVDFGKVDHSFTLEFIHYAAHADVNYYSTKLGAIDKKSYPDFLTGSVQSTSS
jgi:hypothetical protein